MTTHLKFHNGSTEFDTSAPDEVVDIDFDEIVEFDYALNLITQVAHGPAYEWDGPQTMRLIALIASEHLKAHNQSVDFTADDVDAIKEALSR